MHQTFTQITQEAISLISEDKTELALNLLTPIQDKYWKRDRLLHVLLLAYESIDDLPNYLIIARELLSRKITKKDKVLIRHTIAKMLCRKEEFEKSIIASQSILDEYPKHTDSLLNMALCYTLLDQKEVAMTFIKRLENQQIKEKEFVYGELVRIFGIMNEPEKSAIYAKKTLKLNPVDSVSLLELGRFYLNKNDKKASTFYLKKVIAYYPDTGYAQYARQMLGE
jgi:tetratricopeptide (TPR) repeat protein